jgi:hypothetical protein
VTVTHTAGGGGGGKPRANDGVDTLWNIEQLSFCDVQGATLYSCTTRAAPILLGIPAPIATVSPVALDFGSLTNNTTSAAQTIIVSNSGSANLVVSGVTLAGTDSTQFAIVSNGCTTVAPAGSCTINVTFNPTSSGVKSAAIGVAYNAAGSPSSVALTGTGLTPIPVAVVSPASLSFGDQGTGIASAAQAITVSNSGTSNLVVSGLTIIGANAADFNVTNGCTTVAPAGKCTINVTFKPSTIGLKTASVSIAHNAAGSTSGVSLVGTGVTPAPVAAVSPASLAFGNLISGTGAAQIITVKNTGNANLVVSGVTISGVDAASYSVASTTCATVNPGASCTVTVQFAPTTFGAKSASVSIAHNAVGSPSAVTLSGTGIAPSAQASPALLSFANQIIGTTSAVQVITLSNSGNANLVVSAVTMTGIDPTQFAIVNGCTAAVAPAGSCTINVTFKPTTAGQKTASVSITHNAPGSSSSVLVMGTGIIPPTTATIANVSFGNKIRVNTSITKTVLVTNTGTAPLVITSASAAAPFAAVTLGTCSAAVAIGKTCKLNVTFTPTSATVYGVTLTVVSNASNNPTAILSGSGR